jgi:sugar lactone lactonase YvrE
MDLVTDAPCGELELVHAFADGPMPTGVSVSHAGRIFVNFPKWGDDVRFTVAEIRDGQVVPFPDEKWNGPDGDDDEVGAQVVDEGDKGSAGDGLETDENGTIYATAGEQNAILRRRPDGVVETLVHDPRLLWPDTMSVAADGHLYVTANQLHRQSKYRAGSDDRRYPYALFRTRIDAGPVRLS